MWTNGTHITHSDAQAKLIMAITPNLGDCCWEIGMGVPRLATLLSLYTQCAVVATDIGTVVLSIYFFIYLAS